MSDELELLDSKNEPIEDVDSLDDPDVLKEKYKSLASKHKEVGDKNRQLFERTKKAEGDLKELKAKAEESDKKSKAKSEKSDEDIMKRLENMALRMANITANDEVELFNKWKDSTGREADSIIENKIFQAELADLRTTKANAEATSDIKGEGSKSGEKDTPGYWIAKATKNAEGEYMFPEELPQDYKLRSAIVNKLMETSKEKRRFYNQK